MKKIILKNFFELFWPIIFKNLKIELKGELMNKKIFTIFALILLVASISAVSAFDLGDLFGSGKNETITLDGVKFNIPAGYKEDQSNTTNNRLNEFKKK